MALKKQPLLSSKTLPQSPRLTPNPGGGTKRVKMSIAAGAPLLPVGTPIAFNTATSEWVPYAQAGATETGEIAGFILEANSGDTDANGNEGVQLSATEEVLALALHMGEVYRDDVNTAAIRAVLTGAPTEANLDAALRAPRMREQGLVVRGLTGVR